MILMIKDLHGTTLKSFDGGDVYYRFSHKLKEWTSVDIQPHDEPPMALLHTNDDRRFYIFNRQEGLIINEEGNTILRIAADELYPSEHTISV